MTSEVLETIFTGRHKLLEKLVGYCRSSVLTSAKQFTLLVGPRGFGKTHLVALTYYRLKAQEDLRDRMLLAWMREEEWGITSFLDFLLRVFRALQEEYPDLIPEEEFNALYELSPAEAEARAAELLREVADKQTVVLLLENMDDIFVGLGDNGQKRLRAYLQENHFISMMATSPGLFNGVSRRTSSFFGFFRVVHLEPMTFEEAVSLLEKLARLRGDDELADFIPTPIGRARVRAIHHLASGNYRVYVIFSQFLTRKSLDELVEPFLNMLDELTPYYQSRMQLLSPQQRKIVEYLIDYRAAAPVKTIAQRGFMSPQTASSQLSELQQKGYVRSEKQGRESFYELYEPLMRLCIEVKKERGEPIRLFVDFLRIWYSKEEIAFQLRNLDKSRVFEKPYWEKALVLNRNSGDPKFRSCWIDANKAFENHNWISGIHAAEELCAIEDNTNHRHLLFFMFAKARYWKEAIEMLDYCILSRIDATATWALLMKCLYCALEEGSLTAAHNIATKVVDNSIAQLGTTEIDEGWSLITWLVPSMPHELRTSLSLQIVDSFSSENSKSVLIEILVYQCVMHIRLQELTPIYDIGGWVMTWLTALEGKPDYSLAYRLMTAAIQHSQGDDKALLSLPLEERQILLDLLTNAKKTITDPTLFSQIQPHADH